MASRRVSRVKANQQCFMDGLTRSFFSLVFTFISEYFINLQKSTLRFAMDIIQTISGF